MQVDIILASGKQRQAKEMCRTEMTNTITQFTLATGFLDTIAVCSTSLQPEPPGRRAEYEGRRRHGVGSVACENINYSTDSPF
jgi:hypothetical protein